MESSEGRERTFTNAPQNQTAQLLPTKAGHSMQNDVGQESYLILLAQIR